MDITERLRNPDLMTAEDEVETLMGEAAAEIARLRADLTSHCDHIDELCKQLDILRAECARLEDHINDADDESIRLRADVERLTANIKETEFVLTVAVIPDGHERCKIALEKLRAALATGGEGE